MLNPAETAWVIYSVIFVLSAVALAFRCTRTLLLSLSLLLFSALTAIAHFVMLARDYRVDTVVVWVDRSAVINLIPIFSILLFAGLVAQQSLSIQHHAHNNNNINTNTNTNTNANNIHQKKHLTAYLNGGLLALYIILIIAFLCVRLAQNDNDPSTRMQMAVCVTLLLVPILLDLIINLRFMRSWFLRFGPLLLAISVFGMALEAWLFYIIIESRGSRLNLSVEAWILIESFVTYFPTIAFLVLAFFTSPLQSSQDYQCSYPPSNTGYRALRFLRRRWRTEESRQQEMTSTPSSQDAMPVP
ncbi:hypothetical protein BCR43DRAFT_488215 [Syncephalastrum racemosum]|uniref:Uncharacterized protein n=1 Tax=Syncephalastrum racemosum TaxID=13706 RepID=A0A1X2HI95_SYNRA|nr:hypothetical protein BCR43DRAFT_488215 [Syncephalastrum racemosum]